jgi:hypothetical protein
MRYPKSTPLQFSNAQKFVEQYGDDVWEELCDTNRCDEILTVTQVAANLQTLAHLRSPTQYLRAVLKAIIDDFNERPEDYDGKCPIRTFSPTRMNTFSI